jgi:hypothetical protein
MNNPLNQPGLLTENITARFFQLTEHDEPVFTEPKQHRLARLQAEGMMNTPKHHRCGIEVANTPEADRKVFEEYMRNAMPPKRSDDDVDSNIAMLEELASYPKASIWNRIIGWIDWQWRRLNSWYSPVKR